MTAYGVLESAARRWRAHDPDPQSRASIDAMLAAGDHAALQASFGERLQFGTAGIRGVLGVGPGFMNRALVRFVSQGLCEYLQAQVPGARERGIALGHDARRGSAEFAAEAAAVFSAAGFKVLLSPPQSPTPLVAFSLLRHNAAAAVVVTASHNPPEYNGYKVYWGNGAQIIPPHDHGIAAAIDRVIARDEAPPQGEAGPIVPVDDRQAYLAAVSAQCAHALPEAGDLPLRVVYTPLHGVGAELCEQVLAAQGAEVFTVAAQRTPDGGFPTVRFPNPEEPGALDLAEALVAETGAALLVANDPDADRLAAAWVGPSGLHRFTGDELGALFADALLEARGAARNQGERAFVGRSLVSSELLDRIADHYGAAHMETLTGFKWLWNQAVDRQADGQTYVFAYEEALGYSVGPVARDKDGIGAAAMLARIARRGSPLARLEAIYARHGYYATRQKSVSDASPGGLARLQAAVVRLAKAPPSALGGLPVVRSLDFQAPGGDLPPTEGVGLWLSDGTRVLVRPSGTEPKIKVYLQLVETWAAGCRERAGARLDRIEAEVVALVRQP